MTALTGELNPGGDFKTTRLKLTWLADVRAAPPPPPPRRRHARAVTHVTPAHVHVPQIPHLVDLRLEYYEPLISKKKIEEEDRIEDCVNHASAAAEAALGDPNMRSLQAGDVLQLERKGFFICDRAYSGQAGKPIVLINIPDGKEKKPPVAGAPALAAGGKA